MDFFLFGLPKDSCGNTGIVVFVGRLSKMSYLVAEPDSMVGEGIALLFMIACSDNTVCHWQLSRIDTLGSQVNL